LPLKSSTRDHRTEVKEKKRRKELKRKRKKKEEKEEEGTRFVS